MKKTLLATLLFVASCSTQHATVKLKEISFCSEFNHTTILGKAGVECRILWCERDVVDASALMPGGGLSGDSGLPPELVKSRTGNATTLWCIPTEISDSLKQDSESLKKKMHQQREILPMVNPLNESTNDGFTVMPEMKNEKKFKRPVSNEKTFPGVLEVDEAGVYKTMPFILKK
jgi:hypothetical protein